MLWSELANAGHPMFAEVAKVENAELIDLPTGHWRSGALSYAAPTAP